MYLIYTVIEEKNFNLPYNYIILFKGVSIEGMHLYLITFLHASRSKSSLNNAKQFCQTNEYYRNVHCCALLVSIGIELNPIE